MYLSGSATLPGRRLAAAVWAMLIVFSMHGRAGAADELGCCTDDDVNHPYAAGLWEGWSDKGNLFWSEPPGPLALTMD